MFGRMFMFYSIHFIILSLTIETLMFKVLSFNKRLTFETSSKAANTEQFVTKSFGL